MPGIETLVFALVSAGIGWVARHYGFLSPTQAAPQTAPGASGSVATPPVAATATDVIRQIVASEVQKGVAYLEGKLLPSVVAPTSPQTGATGGGVSRQSIP